MTLLTSQQLQAATGCTPERAARWLPHIERACQLYDITTPTRLAAWLAQIGHARDLGPNAGPGALRRPGRPG